MKPKVLIIYGGTGSEHEVSIKSAINILENINKQKYQIYNFYLQKNFIFKNIDTEEELDQNSFWNFLNNESVDIVFPIFHGEYGEGGEFQQELESRKIKFVGSSSKASKIAIDKLATQKVLEEHGILVPKSSVLNDIDVARKLNFPVIIKPVTEGSSIGVYKFETFEELEKKYNEILETKMEYMIQEFVSGREFTCGVYEKSRETFALAVTEIILTKSKMFDFETKYTNGACNEITPADIDLNLDQKMKNLAVQIHKTIGCKDISRTDFIVTEDGNIYTLEINTMPGMTLNSFIPKQVASIGLSLSQFVDILINNNLK